MIDTNLFIFILSSTNWDIYSVLQIDITQNKSHTSYIPINVLNLTMHHDPGFCLITFSIGLTYVPDRQNKSMEVSCQSIFG